jgi:hypothetical protein
MWLTLLVLLSEVIFLSLVTTKLTATVFVLLLHMTRSRSVSISVLSLILFPGTVIHELSHLFVAEILGVHTGKLTLVPDSVSSDEIQTGSVTIVQTDPFRRTLIGIAPLFVGTGTLCALAYFFGIQFQPIMNTGSWEALANWKSIAMLFFYYYSIGTISTSMFSSSEDLKGSLPVVLTLGLIIGGLWMAGIRISVTGPVYGVLSGILTGLATTLGIVLMLDILSLGMTHILLTYLNTRMGVRRV